MNCNDIRPLIEANTDGELDLAQHLEVEAHLRTCPACAREAAASRARRDALGRSLPRFAAPPTLRTTLQARLRAQDGPAVAVVPRRVSPWALWQVSGLAAAVALALTLGYTWGRGREESQALLDEAVSDHVRSLQAGHLLDVVSTDQHTVKPWFAGKLDFSPPVVDLADVGFPLAGGRLEHIDGRPGAALVFRRKLHAINVLVWLPAKPFAKAQTDSKDGFQAERWSQGGLNFMAVAEIPPGDLAQFVAEFRRRAAAGAPGPSGRE